MKKEKNKETIKDIKAKRNDDAKLKIKTIEKQLKEYLNGWKRAKADLENYRKDEEKRFKELQFLLKAGLIFKILPISDSFEGAIKSAPQDQKDTDWLRGVLKIKEQLWDFLKKEGVEEIKAEGETFNPAFHEAIGEAVGPEEKKGRVIQVLQKGYKIGDILLRPSRVYVGK